ncbi:hypothetical protein ME793_02460 [Lactobacillus delbrueckii]|nr:hypothetical protein ME786_17270 [Lactobacillus delbrueckii]GHN27034.1 hypothetical protein ME787_17490 [Lactobacillus delbrueckii]GHN28777.1 hypothetical protein ME788_15890 [Lactobacillus delbrueckii]GHN35293.1 hypothetical protein ME792_04190 [Lactobacillus delbrueckii]GHN37016.1 hypothetical protein ME793_02460 [Lactobacillus delbrueckii]
MEDEELEPQAASIKADNVTAAPAPKNLETFIVLSPCLSILMMTHMSNQKFNVCVKEKKG